MDYISKIIKPFSDKTNNVTLVTLQNKKKEVKLFFDPQNVEIYLSQLRASLQIQQGINMSYINPQYLEEVQNELNQESRAIIVDNLYKLGKRFNSEKRTIHLAVFLMDTYLSQNQVNLKDLNVILDACYLIASKYEEIYPQSCRMYTSKFDLQCLFQIEAEILKALDYRLIAANCLTWLNFYWLNIESPEKSSEWYRVALVFADISLYCYYCLKYEPSKVACACIYASMQALNLKINWNQLAQQFNLHFIHDIKEVTNFLGITLKEAVKQKRSVALQMCGLELNFVK